MSSTDKNRNSSLPLIFKVAFFALLLNLICAPEIYKPVLATFNIQIEPTVNFPKDPLFCPDPKLVTDNLPESLQDSYIYLDEKKWFFNARAPLTSKPLDLHLGRATIVSNGNLICDYLWGDIYANNQNLTLTAPHDEAYQIAGHHWWLDQNGWSICQSVSIDTCAFSQLK